MSAEYEVGYKKPPKAGQFKKGQSGNPKGRPKGTQNVSTVVQKALCRKVTVTVNGKLHKTTVLEATLMATAAKGMGGDTKAAKLVLDLAGAHLPSVPSDAAHEEHPTTASFQWTEEDAKLARFLRFEDDDAP